MSFFRTLPNEIRERVFAYCTKRDLVNFAVSSKFWQTELIPILWNEVTIRREHLAEGNLSGKTLNLLNTRHLKFAGRKPKKQRNYEAFNFGIIVRNCNPEQLTSLTIETFAMKDGLQLLSEMLPMVKSIELLCSNDDKVFDFVSHFKYLEKVFLLRCSIVDEQVMMICTLRRLKVLELIFCNRLTEKSLKHISHVVQLKQFKFESDWEIPSVHLNKTLTKLPNLVKLDLHCANIDETFFKSAVRKFQTLEFLDISRCKISDLCLAAISRLQNLRHLVLNGCSPIANESLASLQPLSCLTFLGLCDTTICDEGLHHVSKVVSLTKLDLYRCGNITDVGLQHISLLKKLQFLDIGEISSVTDKGIEYICNLEYLQHLDAPHLNITNESLKTLSKLNSLEVLNISFCDLLTDDGLHHLSNMKRLRKVACASAKGLTNAGFKKAGLPVFAY